MEIKEEFNNLLDKLKTERDEINLKLHLASLEVKTEFEEAEPHWEQLKSKTADIYTRLKQHVLDTYKDIGELAKREF